MEQVITLQQAQANLFAIAEQMRKFGSSFVVMDKNQPVMKISFPEPIDKPIVKHKRNAGFLKNKANNTPAPSDFDRMNEQEIFKLFAGEPI